MKLHELKPEALKTAIQQEILFQMRTEDRPGCIGYYDGDKTGETQHMEKLYIEEYDFFYDCANQDNYDADGTIIPKY